MRAYLYTETDKNDTTYFLLHQLSTIRQAIAALHDYVDRKVQEQRETRQLLSSSNALRGRLNHRQIALLNHALRNHGEAYRLMPINAHTLWCIRQHAPICWTWRNWVCWKKRVRVTRMCFMRLQICASGWANWPDNWIRHIHTCHLGSNPVEQLHKPKIPPHNEAPHVHRHLLSANVFHPLRIR